MARKKQCNHKMTRYDWGRDATGAEVAIHRWCLGCGAQLGIGPSNDEPAEVRLEMNAAARIAVIGTGDSDVWCGDEFTEIAGGPWQDKFNAALWSWDPSRPIAEQLAETARDNAEADAMEYEATRDAEPDCRDDDPTADCPEHPGARESAAGFCTECVAMIDDSLLAAGKILHEDTCLSADPSIVCSCAGDALRSERCGGES